MKTYNELLNSINQTVAIKFEDLIIKTRWQEVLKDLKTRSYNEIFDLIYEALPDYIESTEWPNIWIQVAKWNFNKPI